MSAEQVTPIYLLSGFLGSGKTTLLKRLLQYFKSTGLRPAVIMNELGEVNLDGLLVQEEVPMAEMLGGCICCSIRADLSLQLTELIQKEQPDVIIIEATGAANPLEILDAVSEASLYMKLEIKPLITVVDSPYLLELLRSQQGKTYRLMQEQIRCASILVLNKTDRLAEGDLEELTAQLEKSNPFAVKLPAVKCELDPEVLLGLGGNWQAEPKDLELADGGTGISGEDKSSAVHAPGSDHSKEETHAHTHHSHEHVMVYTHYFEHPVDSVRFEQLIAELPRDVYRAKGVLTFSDTRSRYLFQYAYREPDFLKIDPQGKVPDVAVFIGEHFDQGLLRQRLLELEQEA